MQWLKQLIQWPAQLDQLVAVPAAAATLAASAAVNRRAARRRRSTAGEVLLHNHTIILAF